MSSQTMYFIAAIVPAIILHEVSHGFVANLFGDGTAKEQHRLTLNPLSHVDPFGTILLPLLLILAHAAPFGYAKPVPVNYSRLRNPRRDGFFVSLAGPVTNILLAAISFPIVYFGWRHNLSTGILQFFDTFGLVNLLLAAFNLLPIPPLDGSAFIERLVPRKHLARYYEIRRMALPVLMVLILLNNTVFHFWDGYFNSLQSWWDSHLISGF